MDIIINGQLSKSICLDNSNPWAQLESTNDVSCQRGSVDSSPLLYDLPMAQPIPLRKCGPTCQEDAVTVNQVTLRVYTQARKHEYGTTHSKRGIAIRSKIVQVTQNPTGLLRLFHPVYVYEFLAFLPQVQRVCRFYVAQLLRNRWLSWNGYRGQGSLAHDR